MHKIHYGEVYGCLCVGVIVEPETVRQISRRVYTTNCSVTCTYSSFPTNVVRNLQLFLFLYGFEWFRVSRLGLLDCSAAGGEEQTFMLGIRPGWFLFVAVYKGCFCDVTWENAWWSDLM